MTQDLVIATDSLVYVTGHRGLVGRALVRELERRSIPWIGRSSGELDLRDRGSVEGFFAATRPTHVIHAAGRVGGILANSTYPADFISDNLRIQVNVLDIAARYGTGRLLFLGSSCIYPKFAPQPITEDSLMTGPLEPTNEAYAIAKISGILQVQALRQQFGVHYISAMPTNLYGPYDNFDLQSSHVMPGMVRRMHDAKVADAPSVTLWGTGAPRREFLHVDDLASACVFLLENYDEPGTINVGVGEDISIAELAAMVRDAVGFTGELLWDTDKPDGTPRKLLEVSRLKALGWQPTIALSTGVPALYEWYLSNEKAAPRIRRRNSDRRVSERRQPQP